MVVLFFPKPNHLNLLVILIRMKTELREITFSDKILMKAAELF